MSIAVALLVARMVGHAKLEDEAETLRRNEQHEPKPPPIHHHIDAVCSISDLMAESAAGVHLFGLHP